MAEIVNKKTSERHLHPRPNRRGRTREVFNVVISVIDRRRQTFEAQPLHEPLQSHSNDSLSLHGERRGQLKQADRPTWKHQRLLHPLPLVQTKRTPRQQLKNKKSSASSSARIMPRWHPSEAFKTNLPCDPSTANSWRGVPASSRPAGLPEAGLSRQ